MARESGYCTFTATIVPLYFSLALCTCNEQIYEYHCVRMLDGMMPFDEHHLKQHAGIVMHKDLDELAECIRPSLWQHTTHGKTRQMQTSLTCAMEADPNGASRSIHANTSSMDLPSCSSMTCLAFSGAMGGTCSHTM